MAWGVDGGCGRSWKAEVYNSIGKTKLYCILCRIYFLLTDLGSRVVLADLQLFVNKILLLTLSHPSLPPSPLLPPFSFPLLPPLLLPTLPLLPLLPLLLPPSSLTSPPPSPPSLLPALLPHTHTVRKWRHIGAVDTEPLCTPSLGPEASASTGHGRRNGLPAQQWSASQRPQLQEHTAQKEGRELHGSCFGLWPGC